MFNLIVVYTKGINIILSRDNHRIGRCVEDTRFQIGEITVSGKHCRIFRERLMLENGDQDPSISVPVFIKDTRFYIYPLPKIIQM